MTWPPRPDAPPDSLVRAFLDAIADSPDDVTTRLVFADCLEERGDPRSEILRLQAAHLRGEERADIERRVEAWLGTYGRDWLGEPSSTPDGFSLRLEADLLAIGSQSRKFQPLLRGGPRLEGLRQAVREGWIRLFRLGRWPPTQIARAAELGLLSGPGELHFLSGMFTDDSLAHLARGTQLRVLYLEGDDATVTEQGLAPLASLVHLRRLSILRLGTLTGSGLSYLAGLKNLRQISFESCPQIGDAVLAPLTGHPGLERLTLARCGELSGAGLARLAALPHLRELDLQGNSRLTVAGMEELVALPTLERLNLYNCQQIVGTGAAHLYGLKRLKWLNVGGCKLKPHETRALRKALPDCKVVC